MKWRNHLKTGVYVVVSGMTWLTKTLPLPVKDFRDREFPSMQQVS